jgi:aminoglycoside phosphotransferase (APT) family kinase protein
MRAASTSDLKRLIDCPCGQPQAPARRIDSCVVVRIAEHGLVAERIHDDELDTSELTVRVLLASQRPEWSDATISYLRTSGTDNAMWRVHLPDDEDVVLRLPRRTRAARTISLELDLLPRFPDSPLARVVATPTVRHVGEPDEVFPHQWAALGWLDGTDAWSARHDLEPHLGRVALDLARAVRTLRELRDLPAPVREPGYRGGPLEPLLARLDRWLDDPAWNADRLIDVRAVKQSAAESGEVAGERVDLCFVHGDLIPGNLLVARQALTAIIDWGSAAYADPAQDLAPAWAVLNETSRRVFREAVEADDATWLRARAFALEQAVGGVLYYRPRRHPLADVMARTLHRILE